MPKTQTPNLSPYDTRREHFESLSAGRIPSAAVIWITGFSGAGKTTVARKVNSLLHKLDVNSILLDGDDLRGIFGNKWGYERQDRIELAHAYFRLCNTLATQGITAVISAIAMYNEIAEWMKANIDRSLHVYLKVPESERRTRDKATKQIYGKLGDMAKMYDEPASADLIIENYGNVSVDDSAQLIINAFQSSLSSASSDKGRTQHWKEYYSTAASIFEPSDYACKVASEIASHSIILEIGCGNGRDASYFASLGHQVTALDPSRAAIDLCIEKHGGTGVEFLNCALPDVKGKREQSFDIAYSRFCFHAMTELEEIDTLAAVHLLLKKRGHLFIECRSINDPLARQGEVLSATERIFGHYRRFIVPEDLHQRLENAGFQIIHSEESNNVAVLGQDNPVVIRIRAERL